MRLILGVCCSLVCSGLAFAQTENIDKDVSPLKLSAAIAHNDSINPLIAGDTDATGFIINAEGALVTVQESTWWQFDYGAEYEQFRLQEDQFAFDDNQDFYSYNLRVMSRTFVHEAFTLDVQAGHEQEKQRYGEGITRFRDEVLSVDTLTRNHASALFVYGREPSRNAFSVRLSWQDDEYDDVNDYARLFDISQVGVEAQARYALSGATRFLVRVLMREDDYVAPDRIDSELTRGLIGIDWIISGKSSAQVLIGGFKRDAEDGSDNSGFSWDFRYQYKPSDLSLLTLSSRRVSNVSEVEFASDSVDVIHGVDWQYVYNELWFWGIRLNWLDKTLESASLERDIKQFDFNASLGFNLTSYQSIHFDFMRRDVSSNDNFLDYTQNEVGLRWQYEY
ncbi:hypothetical protein QTP81_12475 [Alteromonas sp. ASW11-36]|uniref:Porin n=1 Tax=Alteromonas arenosi TaxID=3055817 RepID=A0ABT7SYZ5_9ALTE|nr:hypothetical protein [Alteromonas sp. ASW11-36]MDM7861413.1 hypothetical protein [Alteromonas sp. ASW11-36]